MEVFGPHASPDPILPTSPPCGNPENAVVFDAIIARGNEIGADLILATDPDWDRLGCAARLTPAADAPWGTMTGNQIGSLLTDSLLAARKSAGTLHPKLYVVKTLVTTELMRRIADDYGVQTAGNLLVGFKYMGARWTFAGRRILSSAPRNHTVSWPATTFAIRTRRWPRSCSPNWPAVEGPRQALHQQFNDLFVRYGCHTEGQINVQMPGRTGHGRDEGADGQIPFHPPSRSGGLKLARVRDYLNDTLTVGRREPVPLCGPKGDLVILDLEPEGNYVAVRPSGTERKVKFYMFAYDPPAALAELPSIKAAQALRIKALGARSEKILWNVMDLGYLQEPYC